MRFGDIFIYPLTQYHREMSLKLNPLSGAGRSRKQERRPRARLACPCQTKPCPYVRVRLSVSLAIRSGRLRPSSMGHGRQARWRCEGSELVPLPLLPWQNMELVQVRICIVGCQLRAHQSSPTHCLQGSGNDVHCIPFLLSVHFFSSSSLKYVARDETRIKIATKWSKIYVP